MDDFDVPGLSVAISKGGRLVLARGFGVADQETGEAVTPRHRFRIASLSKPITSIAIHTLIQQRKLNYDSKVFGPESLLGAEYEAPEDLHDITLEHLLTHTAGAWDNKNNDPMFMQSHMDHRELIAWTIQNQPLETTPGSNYAYSNFGYCLLGRIIEK
ncbi:MAG: serine hydrolase domain-containing protein [Planctomycetota bacterium]